MIEAIARAATGACSRPRPRRGGGGPAPRPAGALASDRRRLGRIPAADADEPPAALWFHAASVGELVAARPLLVRLRERFPEHR